MAVARTGSDYTDQDSAQAGSIGSITVPADADLVLVAVSGYQGATENYLMESGELNWDDGATFDFTHICSGLYGGRPCVSLYYMLSSSGDWPGSGSGKTLYWSDSDGNGGFNEGLHVYVAFYKGIDTANPIRDSEGKTSAGATLTSSLSNVDADDMTICAAYAYNDSSGPTIAPSGYGQTALWDPAAYNGCWGAYGEEQGEDEYRAEDLGSYGLIATVALKVASSGTDDLEADDLATGTPTIEEPSLGQVHALSADDLTTGTPTIGEPGIGQDHLLQADDLATGTPTIEEPSTGGVHALSADDLATSAPTIGEPDIGQEHVTQADDLGTPAPTVGEPSLGQVHALSADDVTTPAPTIGEPSISAETETLEADALATPEPEIGEPTLGQVHVLQADDLTTAAPVIGTPGIGSTGLEVWYLDGTDWEWAVNSGFAVRLYGDSSANNLAYNDSGSQTEVTTGNFVLAHVFVSTMMRDDGDPMKPIAFQGRAEYTSLALAEAGAAGEIQDILAESVLPCQGLKPVATVIYECDKSSYTNAVNARIRENSAGSGYIGWRHRRPQEIGSRWSGTFEDNTGDTVTVIDGEVFAVN